MNRYTYRLIRLGGYVKQSLLNAHPIHRAGEQSRESLRDDHLMIALRRMCTKVYRKTERIKTISHHHLLLRWRVVIEGFLPNTAARLLATCTIFSAVCTCYCRLHHLANNSAYLVFSFARQVLLQENRAIRSVMFM